MGIHEVVQWITILPGYQFNVATGRESNPILGEITKEIVLLLRVLVRLGDIHRHPTFLGAVEQGPAVIAADVARATLRRQGKTDFKPCRQTFCAGPGDEQAMKISTVSKAAIANPQHVTITVTWTGFVITHVIAQARIRDEREPGEWLTPALVYYRLVMIGLTVIACTGY